MSLFIGSLYVWTVSLTDADRATHSPMGSLCPVLTLSPRAFGSSQGKGGCWNIWGLGRVSCFCPWGTEKTGDTGHDRERNLGEFPLGTDRKKDLRGFSLSSPAHSFFVHLCFDFSFLSCCICIGTKKGEEREYQQGEQFSQGGMTA